MSSPSWQWIAITLLTLVTGVVSFVGSNHVSTVDAHTEQIKHIQIELVRREEQFAEILRRLDKLETLVERIERPEQPTMRVSPRRQSDQLFGR